MKTIKYIGIFAAAAIVLVLSSCSKTFLENYPKTAIANDVALADVDKLEHGTNGLMLYFASAGYTGRNLQVIGDLIADNLTTARGNSGHMLDIENWNISSSLGEVGTLWGGSYQVISAAVKVLEACDKLYKEYEGTSDTTRIQNCKATALTVKVFAEYYLTEYFCLPYNLVGRNPQSTNGIILITSTVSPDNAKDESSTLSTATLAETYNFMHKQIADAIGLYKNIKSKEFKSSNSAYFPSLCLAYILQARMYLNQNKYNEAIESAENALNNLPTGANGTLVSDPAKFIEQYKSINSPTQEDIFTINFTASDNLSANSINTMFDSYGLSPSEPVIKLIKASDIRKSIYLAKPYTTEKKEETGIHSACAKFPNKDRINNVPVVRVPEIYLLKAEAYIKMNNEASAKTELLKVLGARDTAVAGDMQKMETLYLSGEEDLLNVIMDERRREFTGEGHRWSDLRRNNLMLTRDATNSDNGFRVNFKNFKIANFAFPIPESETNTGAWRNGKLKQNEAWTGTPGGSYSSVLTLPYNGASF